MVVKFPIGICQKVIGVKQKQCFDFYNEWTDIAFNNLDKKMYEKLEGSTTNW